MTEYGVGVSNKFGLLGSDEDEDHEVVVKDDKKSKGAAAAKKPADAKPKAVNAPAKSADNKPKNAAAKPAAKPAREDNKPSYDNRDAIDAADSRRGGRGGRGGAKSGGASRGGNTGGNRPPKHDMDRHSGTGRQDNEKRQGKGAHNWGAWEDENKKPKNTDEEHAPATENGAAIPTEDNAENTAAVDGAPRDDEPEVRTLEEFHQQKKIVEEDAQLEIREIDAPEGDLQDVSVLKKNKIAEENEEILKLQKQKSKKKSNKKDKAKEDAVVLEVQFNKDRDNAPRRGGRGGRGARGGRGRGGRDSDGARGGARGGAAPRQGSDRPQQASAARLNLEDADDFPSL